MELTSCVPADPQDYTWDIVVVGTGAGGGTAGFNLARLGRSVLFLERGKLKYKSGAEVGERPRSPSDAKINAGWWPHGVQRKDDAKFQATMGCGVGGSTALFAMVMDRFRPVDLSPRRFAPEPSATSLPDAWPIEYEELEPYYREAEALYRIRGTDDPLTPSGGPLLEPPTPSETETVVHDSLRRSGLHPYRLPYACEYVPGCDRCFARLCHRSCRNDAGRICVIPALENHGARILTDCRVVRLNTTGRRVSSAVCILNGRQVTIRARTFVLALHALLTPALLLRSANTAFPDGLGNTSGMVGRNLMWHVSDHLLVRFDQLRGSLNPLLRHGISLNDFYVRDGVKLGNIQAHAGDIMRLLKVSPDDSTGTIMFHTMVEDFPYPENRVTPTSDCDAGVLWEYKHRDELRLRSQLLIDVFAQALSPISDVKSVEPAGNLNAGHTCGTCRFGDDPRTSVLDRNNRIHDLENVYVVDASFFPSSGGMNPSLTIVANSLRVSSIIARQ